MAEGRVGSSGYIVKTPSSIGGYTNNKSGFIARNTGGNLSSQVPAYAAPSLNYSGTIKPTPTGGIVKVSGG